MQHLTQDVMMIVVWLVEGTWPAGVDAAHRIAPADADVVLLHVIDPAIAAIAHGAHTGLIGRGRQTTDPGAAISTTAETAEQTLLRAAATRLNRPATWLTRRGRPEQEVTAVAANAGLLIAVRDRERTQPGPRSLAPPTRFVIDHTTCPVLLVWPNDPQPPE